MSTGARTTDDSTSIHPREDTPVTTTEKAPAVQPQAEPERISGLRRVISAIGVQNISLIIAIAIVVAIIGIQNPLFFTVPNLKVIGTAIAIVGLLAVVQTIVIILGALDISVGSVAGLTSVASAMIFTSTSSAALGVLGAVIIGLVCGLINGCIIVFGRVNPVIATLATLAAFKGVAQLISDGRAQGYTGADPFFVFLARGTLLGIPVLIWVLIVVAVLAHVVLRYTSIGRNIYAVGGNNIASRLGGININRYIIGVYMVTGAVAAIAGILITARTGSGQPISGSEGLELQAITAAALGGAALKGGKGAIAGTILAVILLGVLTNGMTLLGVNTFWQNVAQGALLVAAVVIQQLRSGERRIGIPG
ncbi:L-arabinose ABC transporter permease [Cnuibacter physcomitrellae]|uniref:Sugar ABC transporter permease n=1 Tax=Cnuibacter physcomitrellae TaxID=1619308 RepID=A0A1X9LLP4_9MICO|nr:ABC transporter permease [Cnuibacter physcomitrellae]ARJ04029.1 sugar ABC transporter permease [Cnuibacter physcomitrellae]GGI40069.1 L-arabinose ABC transporter permease [Cnuibacter physcomitrellae]